MAAELLQKQEGDTKTSLCAEQGQHEEELDNLLAMARSKGYSYQGEMYSTENLGQLAGEFYGLGCRVISYGFEDRHFIISELLKGSAVLVPYDADKNHKPCLENGHKAHWALLTGQCNNNLILTECNSCTGEYWPEVMAVRTKGSKVRTKMTESIFPSMA